MQKLGKNLGGYYGETIDILGILREVQSAASTLGWTSETFHNHGDFDWVALHRASRVTHHASRIHISAGTHGDEPAGPLAALKLIQQDQWPDNVEISLLPCLNPYGFTLNTRANREGIDINRDYRNPKADETRMHIAWLEKQPRFDLYICLHEDWESQGFYLYETNPNQCPSFAEQIINAVVPVCPVDGSESIEGRPASGGIIRPNIIPLERLDWPEAFYHITHTARQGYTLEAPSDFALPTRVDALVAGTTAAVSAFAAINPVPPAL